LKEEYFYYLKAQKEIGKHIVSISALGSHVNYGVRRDRQKIETYNTEYAVNLYKGSDDLYRQLSAFNVASNIQRDRPTDTEARLALEQLAQSYGWGSLNEDGTYTIDRNIYANLASQNDFIDTVGVITQGERYNNHWGSLNDGIKNESVRQYHKPIFSVRDFWAISDRVYLSNVVYYSSGRGGGTSRSPGLGFGDYDENQQDNFQASYLENTVGSFFPPIDTRIDSIKKRVQ